MTTILGISAYYHDSAAALIRDGVILSAVQEERFTRKKHDFQFPSKSIEYILDSNGIKLKNIDMIVFYEKPFLKFDRILETFFAHVPYGLKSFVRNMPIWVKEKIFQKRNIIKKLKDIEHDFTDEEKICFSEHHLSHAASAFYPSPFDEAAVLTLDGVGEWATSTISIGKGNELNILKEIHYPHSLGLLYSSFTYYAGFKVNSGEYKLMGLAPYGKPIYEDLILSNIINVKSDGSFFLNQKYFSYSTNYKMINKEFEKLFGNPARKFNSENIDQFYCDIAASIQKVLEIIVLKITKSIREEYKIKNLCMAGGVALNCVANGKILKNKIFDKVWIQPASGDAGGALGAALYVYYSTTNNKRTVNGFEDSMKGSFLGPCYSDRDIITTFEKFNANYRLMDEIELIEFISSELAKDKIIGWFQGNSEFGPRALGNRSILANPMNPEMQKNLNLKIKFRENFRPFAVSILEDEISNYFELNDQSPYMLIVAKIIKSLRKKNNDDDIILSLSKINEIRSKFPAITHIDYSSRIQTVNKKTNNKFYNLLKNFREKSGSPMLINTSFNIRGEPIVNTPEDAYKCFMGTEIDILVINNNVLLKEHQNSDTNFSYKNNFELD